MPGLDQIFEHDGIPTLDDSNWKHWSKGMSGGVSESGYIPPEFRPLEAIQAQAAIAPFPANRIIPRAEWPDRIADRVRRRARFTDLVRAADCPKEWLNQSPTNSCWCFGPTQGYMMLHLKAGGKWVRLSPYSVSGPINGYRDNGGWGLKSIQFAMKEGVADTDHWAMSLPGESPESANRKAITGSRAWYEPSRENAALHKVTEVYSCRNLDEKVSAIFWDFVVPDGYNYEGHETCSMDVVQIDGVFGVTDMDSYTKDGSPHLRNRMGNRAMGDDALAIRVGSAW